MYRWPVDARFFAKLEGWVFWLEIVALIMATGRTALHNLPEHHWYDDHDVEWV
jgi:hypothetical protein